MSGASKHSQSRVRTTAGLALLVLSIFPASSLGNILWRIPQWDSEDWLIVVVVILGIALAAAGVILIGKAAWRLTVGVYATGLGIILLIAAGIYSARLTQGHSVEANSRFQSCFLPGVAIFVFGLLLLRSRASRREAPADTEQSHHG